MKTIAIPLIAFLFFMTITGCKKEQDTVQPTSKVNTAPVVNAGADQLIFLPVDSCMLYGNAVDMEQNIQSTLWKKIAGPATYHIEDPGTLTTKVSHLVEGDYQFELAVTDSAGLSAKDTVNIEVVQHITLTQHSTTYHVMLPQDYLTLNTEGFGHIITQLTWLKLNGPASYKIVNNSADYTSLYELVEGSYQFELTANYGNGVVRKDTLNVILHDVSNVPQNAKELLLPDQKWIYPWYSEVEIKQFYKMVPTDARFRIYIKRDGSSNWEYIPGMPYVYTSGLYEYYMPRFLPEDEATFLKRSMQIACYGPYPTDTPDIKIVYW